jgi:tetratricopeptide (TPR) repeat protein
MSVYHRLVRISTLLTWTALAGASWAAGTSFESELAAIQHEWEVANYQVIGEQQRKAAFATLVEHAARFSAAYPERAEAAAWEGIVLSTYAGEVSAMSAMKYAKAARAALTRAERMDADTLNGGAYASLGALYFKVPGGMLGFGDDAVAEEYFTKALAVDPDNIDSNYLYGEFLLDQERFAEALIVLNRALGAPVAATRPIFDAGRRAEIRALIAIAQRETGV